MQGFKFANNNEFIVKEAVLAREELDKKYHWLFDPPCSKDNLDFADWTTVNWLQSNHHGLSWNDGSIPYAGLDEKVRETYVKPAKLSTIDNTAIQGEKVIIVGWGSPEDTMISKNIEIGLVKVLTVKECTKEIKRASGIKISIDDTHLCTASSPYLLTVPGDSGGPILYYGMILGVNVGICPIPVSETTCIPKTFQVNIHMSVYHHREFIVDVMEN
ncbi:hypothetical protein QAD02_018473 [Eretmocerus hayati]|uniref:Uncharacterized protein n=1 Tax=Eretmocerus hayati TaxID=131215 RepID=A0ACC2PI49_9HYME|nr:hypothetical protein QAD02_018473 [Eretmocerus hayati]